MKGVQCYHDIVHNPHCLQCELLAGEMSSFAFHVSWPCMCYASEIFSKIKYVPRVPIDTLYRFIPRHKKVYFARDSVNPGRVVNSFYSGIMKHLCALTSALTIVARSSDDNFAYTLYIIQCTANIILRPSTHLETDSKASH